MVPLGTGQEKPRNKGKKKPDQGISLSIVARLCSKLVTALLKLLPTIFPYAEFCSNLRNILDLSKTSLEVTISINPLLTDIQVKHICLSATT